MRTNHFADLFSEQPTPALSRGIPPMVDANFEVQNQEAGQKEKWAGVASGNSPRITRVYQVTVDTDGEHRGMTVIDPSGNGFEAFQKSCRNRFGEDRVVSIELRR